MSLTKLIEAQRELVERLDEYHVITMTSKGRNPKDYVSAFSRFRDDAAAILRALEEEGRDG